MVICEAPSQCLYLLFRKYIEVAVWRCKRSMGYVAIILLVRLDYETVKVLFFKLHAMRFLPNAASFHCMSTCRNLEPFVPVPLASRISVKRIRCVKSRVPCKNVDES